MKFNGGFVKGARESLEKQKEQRRLHLKHTEIDEKTVIVEKDNMGKFLIRCLARLIRLTAMTCICILAAVGAISLIYPEIRLELLQTLQIIARDTTQMIGF